MIVNKNKTILFLTVIATILIVALPTILKISERHDERMYIAASRKVLESAETCYRDQVCKEKQMTIGDLKKIGYLKEEVVNPRTKTYFEDNMIMVEDNFHVTFKDF